jgi:hypothetical protein
MVEKRNAYRILVGKPGRMGWYCMDWIDLAQDRDQWRALVNTVMYIQIPYNAGKFFSCTVGGFSRSAQLRK